MKVLTFLYLSFSFLLLTGCNIQITSDEKDANTAPLVSNFVFYLPVGFEPDVVSRLTATDSEGDAFSFSIQGDNDYFQVTFDGVLSVNQGVTLDFASGDSYVFSIIVTDSRGAMAIAQVEIRKQQGDGEPTPDPSPDPEPSPDPDPSPEPEAELSAVVRSSIKPLILPLEHVTLERSNGLVLHVNPVLSNGDALNGVVHWSKRFGPDDLAVNPSTGAIRWDIADDLPSESFHIGLKVCGASLCDNTSFIVHLGVTSVMYVGVNETHQTIAQGLAALPAGGTLVIRDGVYEGNANYMGLTLGGALQHPPSGTASGYTTVMAEHIGQVTLTNGASVKLRASPSGSWSPVLYVAIKGLFVDGGQLATEGYGSSRSDNENRHHHIKFIHNGATGADTQSPFSAFRSDDILFEGNYAFGQGRYKLTSYQAENIVYRRNVARYDVGTHANEPKGTYSAYTTNGFVMHNNIAVDGDQERFTSSGELAGEFTTPTTSGNSRGKIERNIQLNSEYLLGNMDEQISNGSGGDSDVEVKDHVSWDIRPYSRYIMSWGSAWFDHMTMGNVTPRETANTLFNGYHQNTRGVTNSLIHNFQNGDLFYGFNAEAEHTVIDRTVARYGVNTVNISSTPGVRDTAPSSAPSTFANITEHAPLKTPDNTQGGLRYLTKMEPQSNFSAAANDGTDLGAKVMTFKGKSGTLYGETDFDSETQIPMWPFPLQDIIHQKFSQYQYEGPTYTGYGSYWSRTEGETATLNGNRGFAVSGETLTHYIWGYLGSHVPPMELSAVSLADSNAMRLQWNRTAATTAGTITGYNIYAYNAVTGDKGVLLGSTQANELAVDVPLAVLSDHQVSAVVVTAISDSIDSSGASESGFAYPLDVTAF